MTLPCTVRWLAAVAVLLLASCGGGGGGGDADSAQPGAAPGQASASGVTFEPPVLQASFAELGQGQGPDPATPAGATVTARFATPPEGPVFMVIEQDRPVLDGRILAPESTSDSVRGFLPFGTTLPPGTYSGNITLLLCRDASCRDHHPGSGAVLPYSVTVTPGIHLTVRVNGQRVDARPVTTRSGDRVEVESDMPVQWFQGSSSGGIARDVLETPTTWAATAEYGISTPGSVGDFSLDALANGLDAPLLVKVTE